MDEEQQISGPLRVGMRWGGIGGVVGFLVSLALASFGAIVAAIFVGLACGRRAVAADEGEKRGARSGLTGGLMAAPVFVLGAASGALIGVRQVGMDELSSTASELSGLEVSNQEAWILLLAGLAFAAFVQAAALILSSVLAAGRVAKKEREEKEQEEKEQEEKEQEEKEQEER